MLLLWSGGLLLLDSPLPPSQVTALCRLTLWLFVIHCLHASVFLAHGRTRIHAACIMNEVALSQYPHYLPPLFLSHLSFLCDIPISTSTSILLS